ncbi:MAG: UDP-2,3-diacylglucosamine diphosphatase LpxI [Micavibrio aeruginosavorus]|uniref:UDP-2,3-diacylglucosamine diphosphatase LpxI n=1 Tax=Micavibrio aeruginosavorus TaxID=349221 RepID=A0A7T5UFM3_9BACT|nr:MAG: UDP-2,3-diacylglucosamine diphosphatase LpxI [Micavibrio aeruginosavorus]
MSATEKSSLKTETGIERLGVIAGTGRLPARLLAACDHAGIDVFVVGFEGQTDKGLYKDRQFMNTRIGAAGTIINTLKAHDIRDLVMIGAIKRPTLMDLKPDLRTARFFAKVSLRALGDDGLLKAMKGELEREGFRIHGVQKFAHDLLASEGALGRYKPARHDWPDIRRGIEVLRALGAMDVGQSTIVQDGVVLGIEATEGTDELIRRCGAYRKKGNSGVLVKLAKPGQDETLDLPTVGPETIRLCAEAGLIGIVLEAGRSLIVEPEDVAELANKHRIFVVAIKPDEVSDEL